VRNKRVPSLEKAGNLIIASGADELVIEDVQDAIDNDADITPPGPKTLEIARGEIGAETWEDENCKGRGA
jgi:hypothetical protein